MDDNSGNYNANQYLRTILAIAKGESDLALSYIELMANTAEKGIYSSSQIGRLYLEVGKLEKAAYWFEKAIENEWGLISPWVSGDFKVPENLPNHPALQAALDSTQRYITIHMIEAGAERPLLAESSRSANSDYQ